MSHSCPVCDSNNSRLTLRADVDIYRCSTCSHVFSDQDAMACVERYDQDYYAETHKNWFKNQNTHLFSWIAANFGNSITSVLDVGCGNGAFLQFLASYSPGIRRLVGVDYSENSPVHGIEYLTGDIEDMPGEETFSAVVSLAVVEHVADPVEFSRVLASRCKDDGLVVIMTLDNDSILYIIARLLYRLGIRMPATRLYSAHHLQHFTPKSLRTTLRQAGLHEIRCLRHNTPLAAIDIPANGIFQRIMFTCGTMLIFWLGLITQKTYLQTIIARKGVGELN